MVVEEEIKAAGEGRAGSDEFETPHMVSTEERAAGAGFAALRASLELVRDGGGSYFVRRGDERHPLNAVELRDFAPSRVGAVNACYGPGVPHLASLPVRYATPKRLEALLLDGFVRCDGGRPVTEHTAQETDAPPRRFYANSGETETPREHGPEGGEKGIVLSAPEPSELALVMPAGRKAEKYRGVRL